MAVALFIFGLALPTLLPAVHGLQTAGPVGFWRDSENGTSVNELCTLPEAEDPEAEGFSAEAGTDAEKMLEAGSAPKLVFNVHRKTGYILSNKLAECINGVQGEGAAKREVAAGGDEWFKKGALHSTVFVHMTRDPLDLLLSSYFYDKVTSKEHGTTSEGSALKFKKRMPGNLRDMGFAKHEANAGWMEVNKGESLKAYLNRVGPEQGLRATLAYSWRRVAHIAAGRKACLQAGKKTCTQVYLNSLMRSSDAFKANMKRVLALAGIEPKPKIMQCMAMQDTHSKAFLKSRYAKHCSSHDVTEKEREHYKDLLRKVDKKYFKGVYQAMSAKWQGDYK